MIGRRNLITSGLAAVLLIVFLLLGMVACGEDSVTEVHKHYYPEDDDDMVDDDDTINDDDLVDDDDAVDDDDVIDDDDSDDDDSDDDDSDDDDQIDDDDAIGPCESVQVNNGALNEDNDGDGFTELGGDCDDTLNSINPGVAEVFDGLDNDCDGTIDDGFDDDCDGYAKVSEGGLDCNDNNALINPDQPDNDTDDVDENCDGKFGDASSGDLDGDQYAATGTGDLVIDCDDNDPTSNPNGIELPGDGVDQNCDGVDLTVSDAAGVFVAKTGSDANLGTMASPKLTINAGVALAKLDGRAVFIAAGEYEETISTKVSLFGGYTESDWSRDIDVNETILTSSDSTTLEVKPVGNVALSGLQVINTQDNNQDSVAAKIYGRALISDCLFQAGTPTVDMYGSVGMYVFGSAMIYDSEIRALGPDGNLSDGIALQNSGDTTVSGCVLKATNLKSTCTVIESWGNLQITDSFVEMGSAYWTSYGLRLSGDVSIVRGNTIVAYSEKGTTNVGISAEGELALISNNYISAGEGSHFSHGVQINDGEAVLVNNLIIGGEAGFDGYGVSVADGTATIVNNTIIGGNADYDNINVIVTDTAVLVNNILYNSSAENNISIGIKTGGSVTAINNDVWSTNDLCVVYDDTETDCIADNLSDLNGCAWSGCESASDNITDDPSFMDPGINYHIPQTSSCVDAGIDPATWYSGDLADLDMDGNTRPYGSGWDIGAYEWTPIK